MLDTNDVILKELIDNFYTEYQQVLLFMRKCDDSEQASKITNMDMVSLERFRLLKGKVEQILGDYQFPELPEDNPEEFNRSQSSTLLYMLYRKCEAKLADIKAYLERGDAEAQKTEFPAFLDEVPSGKIIEHVDDGPKVLEDYRQNKWGIIRVCLDGIQNHLPEDSKGTMVYLQFLVDDVWVDCETAKRNRDKITKVRFADDGVGLTIDDLFYFHTNKPREEKSAGQFGEGLKLLSTTSVNEGLGLEIQSLQIDAHAYGKEKKTTNTRAGRTEDHIETRFAVDVYDGPPIKGTRTIFNTPTPEFIDYALSLPEKVMILSGKEPEFDCGEDVQIIDTSNGGQLLVKGIFLKEDPRFLFSYNFNTAEVTPDRDDFSGFSPQHEAAKFIAEKVTDKEIIKTILRCLIEYSSKKNDSSSVSTPQELYYLPYVLKEVVNQEYGRDKTERTDLWKTALSEVCKEIEEISGKKVVLDTGNYLEITPGVQEKLNECVVVKSIGWERLLSFFGMPTVETILPDYEEEVLETSIGRNYGKEVCDNLRMILEFCQNHLPNDSKGDNAYIRFQTRDGKWHEYSELTRYSNEEIKSIKIADDGIGYDYENLRILESGKDSSSSSGKWGEGVKLALVHAARNGIQVKLHSRNWVTIPFFKKNITNEGFENEKVIDKLMLRVQKDFRHSSDGGVLTAGLPKSSKLSDGDKDFKEEKSSTTIENPPDDIIEIFRNIREYVLYFSNDPRIYVGGRQILDNNGGKLYVKNIRIPGNHHLRYSYHLPNFDIKTRDRDFVSQDDLMEEISQIFSKTTNEDVIKDFLIQAIAYSENRSKNGGRQKYLEFETPLGIKTKTLQASMWIKNLQKVCKEQYNTDRICIRRESSMDANMIHMAQHAGVKVITLPNELVDNLSSIEGQNGEKIPKLEDIYHEMTHNIVEIDPKKLSRKEMAVYKALCGFKGAVEEITEPVWHKPLKKIYVFDYPKGYTGEKALGMCWYQPDGEDRVYISRDALKEGEQVATDTYLHEVAHYMTGASDPAPAFRDCLSYMAAALLRKCQALEASIKQNEMATGITMSDVSRESKSFKDRFRDFKERLKQGADKLFEGVRLSIEEDDEIDDGNRED